MTTQLQIGFAGISHLSLVYGAALSNFATSISFFDTDDAVVKDLATGKNIIVEPGLDNILFQSGKKFRFTNNLKTLADSDVIIVAKDIITDDQNTSDYSMIRNLLQAIAENRLNQIPVIVMSQVEPGFCRSVSSEFESLTYFVETLIFGEALQRAKCPERLIIGKQDATSNLPTIVSQILKQFNCPILETNYESAELAKISINLFLASSVTLSNHIANVSSKIGADWKFIAECLRLDKRIGKHAYLQNGLGISGGNLERDLRTYDGLTQRTFGIEGLIEQWNFINGQMKLWPSLMLQEHLQIEKRHAISFMGLAYKKNTDSIKNAPSIANVEFLNQRVVAYDAMVNSDFSHPLITRVSDINLALNGADAVVIFNDSREFEEISDALLSVMQGDLIIDPFGVLEHKISTSKFRYFKM